MGFLRVLQQTFFNSLYSYLLFNLSFKMSNEFQHFWIISIFKAFLLVMHWLKMFIKLLNNVRRWEYTLQSKLLNSWISWIMLLSSYLMQSFHIVNMNQVYSYSNHEHHKNENWGNLCMKINRRRFVAYDICEYLSSRAWIYVVGG